MPPTVCMNPHFKEALALLIQKDRDTPEPLRRQALSALEAVPPCGKGEPFAMLGKRGKGTAGNQGKRPPSAYNQFVSSCLKTPEIQRLPEQTEKMRACARRWRAEKPSPG